MEVERTFKCCDCDAKFPTPDLLTVHQRRHEMSLNLSLKPTPTTSLLTPSILNKGSLSAGIIGFVDETPTPTRFIRNCEEVGLFQDLQNVNPFDEDFKKAANSGTGTPLVDGGNAFDFSFSSAVSAGHGGSPTPTSSSFRNAMMRSKRRYSDQDSLNTPQVHFPYLSSSSGCHLHTLTTNTASMSACLTPTPQNSIISQESLRSVLQIETPTTPTTTYNHEEHASIIAYTSVISQQTSSAESNSDAITPVLPLTTGFGFKESSSVTAKMLIKVKSSEADKVVNNQTEAKTPSSSSSSTANAGHMGSRISLLKIRSKANLKLDLKTKTMDSKNGTNGSSNKSAIEKPNRDSPSNATESPDVPSGTSSRIPEKGLLGTTREILDRKRAASYRSRERRKIWIDSLESKCRELEALLEQSQAEVIQLKAENHIMRAQLQRDSTKGEDTQRKTSQTLSTTMIPMTNENSRNLLSQSCQTELSNIPQDPLADVEETTCSTSENMKVETKVARIQLPIPTLKAKRGRPRKGQERRVPVSSLSVISPSGEVGILPKIPILPLPNRRLLSVVRKV